MRRNWYIVVMVAVVAAALFGYQQLLFSPGDSKESQSATTTQRVNSTSPSSPTATEEAAKTQGEATSTNLEALGRYTVDTVVDGDTFRVWDGTEFLTVRILGIDAPETEHAAEGPECYNEEATAAARKLLAGSLVTLRRDHTQQLFDEYGRLIAYVALADGTDFGEWMVRNGYAKEYTFKGVPYEKQSAYQAAESQAKEAEKGVWACN